MPNPALLEPTKTNRYEFTVKLPDSSTDITHLAEELDAAFEGGLTYWKAQSVHITGRPEHVAVFVHYQVGEMPRDQKLASSKALIFWMREWGVTGCLLSLTHAHSTFLLSESPDNDY